MTNVTGRRVRHVPEPDRLVLTHRPGLTERGGGGLGGKGVQVLALLGQHLQPRAPGHPVGSLVELAGLLLAGDHELAARSGAGLAGRGRRHIKCYQQHLDHAE